MKSFKKILAVVAMVAASSAYADGNPCAAKNPCAMKANPCAAKNPCGETHHKKSHHKKEANPCAAKNPCAGKM
ncbi:MAG: hypothetical protein K2P57_08215 [Burkholderiales bacterium]|nr:hypothetical protein [Burkholderiales bacterium]